MSYLNCEEAVSILWWYERESFYQAWLRKGRSSQESREEDNVLDSEVCVQKLEEDAGVESKVNHLIKSQDLVKDSSAPKEEAATDKKSGRKRRRKNRRSRGVVKQLPGIEIKQTAKPKKRRKKKSKTQSPLEEYANRLIKELKKFDFHILRYDAKSSNSIYLKIDYGVACSVRISDHMGYEHLHYRFNVIEGLKESKTIQHDGHERHFIRMDEEMLRLVSRIIIERNSKRKKYGESNYEAYQEREKTRVGKDAKGFFSQCREV